VSAVFAVILSPAVNAVHRLSLFGWQPSRGASILLILLTIAAALVLLFAFAVPPIIGDLTDLGKQLPQKLNALHWSMNSVPVLRSVNPGSIERYFASIAGTIGSLVTNVTQAVAAAVAIPTLTAYLILDSDRAFNWARF
jgi:predicted PurR-regulated permease PerM